MGKHLSTDMEDKTYTHQQSSNSVDRTSRTFSINNSLSSTCSNSHRQRRKSPPSDSDSDSYATRPCIQPPASTPKRNEEKRSSLQPSCMHANPTRPTCDHKSRTSSNRSGDNEIHPTRLPTYLAIDPLVHPPDNQTNLISPSVIRQKPTIDKTDVAVRVPSRPGSQVQDCPGHLVFDSHPLRRNQSPRHHAARVLPRFGDGGCHVGGEP